ncbi:MAG: RHS repeat domain-containing protein [Myxococcota bacterium]
MRFSPARRLAICTAWLTFAVALPTVGAEVVLDEDGNVVQEVEPDGYAVEYRHDDQGRVIEEVHDDGTVVRYWYDENGVQHVVTD